MDKKKLKKRLIRIVVGILALIVLILLGLWLGGIFDSTPAPPPTTRDNNTKLDLRLPNASKMNKAVIARLQRRVSKQKQGDVSSSESQEKGSVEETPQVLGQSKKTKPAANEVAPVKKVSTDQSAPSINSSTLATLSPKTLAEEAAENGNSVHKQKDVVKWIPDPSKLKLSLFADYYYQFVDFVRRLSAADNADYSDKVGHYMVNSIFNELNVVKFNNPEFAKSFGLAENLLKVRVDILLQLNAETMKSWKEDLAKPDGTLMPIITLLTHEFFPIFTRLPSFREFKFEDETLALEAYEVVFHFLLTFEQKEMKPEVFALIKKVISSTEVIEALKTVYAGDDYAMILAAQDPEELYNAILYLSSSAPNIPVLVVLGSVMEEPLVRIFHRLLNRVFQDRKFDGIKSLIGKLLTAMQSLAKDTNLDKDWLPIIQELKTLYCDEALCKAVRAAVAKDNVAMCARDVFGEGQANKLLQEYGSYIEGFIGLIDAIELEIPSFSEVLQISAMQIKQLTITSSLVVQLLLRLASDSSNALSPEVMENLKF